MPLSDSGSSVYEYGSSLNCAEVEAERPSLDDRLIDGRNMMLVIVSGFHSNRICAFHELLRENCWLSELLNDFDELTKFSDDDFERVLPLLWFHRTEPSHENVLPLSKLKLVPTIFDVFRPLRPRPNEPRPNPMSLVLLSEPNPITRIFELK